MVGLNAKFCVNCAGVGFDCGIGFPVIVAGPVTPFCEQLVSKIQSRTGEKTPVSTRSILTCIDPAGAGC